MRGYYKCENLIGKFNVMGKLFNLGYDCYVTGVGRNTSSFEEWWSVNSKKGNTHEYLLIWIEHGSFGFCRNNGVRTFGLPELKRLEILGHSSFKHTML
jgi:hypothetical protein